MKLQNNIFVCLTKKVINQQAITLSMLLLKNAADNTMILKIRISCVVSIYISGFENNGKQCFNLLISTWFPPSKYYFDIKNQ